MEEELSRTVIGDEIFSIGTELNETILLRIIEANISNISVAIDKSSSTKFNKSSTPWGAPVLGEVIFNKFIRPEKKFNNIIELKNQIKRDIKQAK